MSVEVQRVAYRGVAGIIVALHRPSGEVEMYAEPGLGLDRDWFAGDPAFGQFELAVMAETTFDVARCDVAPGLVDMEVHFDDSKGRRVEVRARRRWSRSVAELATPAPLQTRPVTLRFLLMQEFRLLPDRGSDISVVVDGTAAEIKRLPPDRLNPLTQARMSTNLLMAGLAPNHVERRLTDPSGWEARDRLTSTTFDAGHLVEAAISNDHCRLAMRFVDPLPNPVGIVDGRSRSGLFIINSSMGPVATGTWELARRRDELSFALRNVVQDWKPPAHQPVRGVIRQVRRLRRRKLDWRYDAVLRQRPEGWTSSGSWSIIGS